jgi:hypothetical protein
LQSIKTKRPDLRLHGFGLKVISLGVSEIQNLLYTADSAAATLAGGKGSKKYQGLDGYGTHDPRAGLAYEIKIYEAYLRSCTTSYQEDACYRYLKTMQMAITRIANRSPTRRKAKNVENDCSLHFSKTASGSLSYDSKQQRWLYGYKVNIDGKWRSRSKHVPSLLQPLVEDAIKRKETVKQILKLI